jgi:uncharacterized protein
LTMRRTITLVLVALVALVACATAPSTPRLVATAGPAAPRAQPRNCPAPSTAPQPQVMTVDWSDSTKIELADAMQGHVAVVRYDCDGVEVLRDCHASGSYAYAGVSPARTAIRLEDAEQLRSTLPFAGADLRRAIDRNEMVDVAYLVVGQLMTPRRSAARVALAGDCAGATHIVRSVSLGAFAIATAKRGTDNAGAALLGAGPMANSVAVVERTGGELRDCYLADFGGGAAAPIPKCRALVSLILAPIVDDTEDPPPGPDDDPTKPPAPRIAERERFETLAVTNPCKIGERAATKDGACVSRTSTAPFLCDFTELEECRAQCEKGDGRSCWNVAAFILDTRLSPTKGDPRPEALVWLTKSCVQGYAHGCGNAGEALRRGIAVEKDVKRGLTMLTKACTSGDPLSCMVVAGAESLGDGMPSNPKSAREHYERACALSQRRGCNEAASFLEKGQGGPRDIAGAIRLYERACSETTEASCQRGRKLAATEASLAGEGARVVLDDRRVEIGTAAWTTPCKAGLRADEATSTCMKPDPTRTFVCDASLLEECRHQCDRGSMRSCWNAAFHLRTLAKTPKSEPEAAAFFDRACRGGHGPACTQLGVIMLVGSGVPKDREHGLPLVEKGCAAKDAPGCAYLGKMYSWGSNGAAVDRRRSAAYYEKGCDLGDKNACTSGAQVLSTYVEGAYQDPSRALRLLEGACKLTQDERSCRAAAALRANGATP